MTRLSLLAWGAILASLACAPVEAQVTLDLQLTPVVGGTFYLTDPPARFALQRGSAGDLVVSNGRFGHSVALGGSVGLRLADHLAAEAVLLWTPTELRAEGGLEGGRTAVNSYMYAANFLFLLPRIGRVEPFLTLGYGREEMGFALPGIDRHAHRLWSMGPGATVALSDRLAVRLDLKDCITAFEPHFADHEKEQEHHLMPLVGLTYTLPVTRR